MHVCTGNVNNVILCRVCLYATVMPYVGAYVIGWITTDDLRCSIPYFILEKFHRSICSVLGNIPGRTEQWRNNAIIIVEIVVVIFRHRPINYQIFHEFCKEFFVANSLISWIFYVFAKILAYIMTINLTDLDVDRLTALHEYYYVKIMLQLVGYFCGFAIYQYQNKIFQVPSAITDSLRM